MTTAAPASARGARRPVTLWRLELLRLLRTRRLLALLGAFSLFGLLGPVIAAHLPDLVGGIAGDVQIIVPDPEPADGITQFTSNAQQVGLLVALYVAASALAFDGRTELAVFLRTRVRSMRRLLLPRFVVSAAATCLAFTVGALLAWCETWVLLGAPPTAAMLAGIAYTCVYLVFAVATVALASALLRSTVTVVVAAVSLLLALPVLGLVDGLGPWLPSHLVGALDELVRGAPLDEHLRAAAVGVAASTVFVAAAVVRLERREV